MNNFQRYPLLRLALLLCAGFVGWAALVAHGQTLTFQSQDVPAATALLTAWQAENPSGWWSWAVTPWDQNADGKVDLYFSTHSGQGGTLLRQGATFNEWEDVTAALVQSRAAMPSENRPLAFDFDNDGWVDLAATGDENTKVNRRNVGAALELEAGRIGLTSGQLLDINLDGYMDYRGYIRSFGVLSQRDKLNCYGGNVPTTGDPASEVFHSVAVDVPLPAGLPAAIVSELTALTLPPHSTATSNRYCSPQYEHTDLNGDGLLDLVIQYGGSYSGSAYRFGRYLIRLPDQSLVDVTATCGIPPTALPLFPLRDSTGDGKIDVIVGYASTATAGLYKQVAAPELAPGAPGVAFQLKRVDGSGVVASTLDLWASVYATSASYLPELRWQDLDNDGDEDLIVSTRRGGAVRVYERRGGDLIRVLAAGHADADGWAVCNLNGDALPDLVTFGSATHSNVAVKFHLNTSPTGEIEPPPPPPPPPPAAASRRECCAHRRRRPASRNDGHH